MMTLRWSALIALADSGRLSVIVSTPSAKVRRTVVPRTSSLLTSALTERVTVDRESAIGSHERPGDEGGLVGREPRGAVGDVHGIADPGQVTAADRTTAVASAADDAPDDDAVGADALVGALDGEVPRHGVDRALGRPVGAQP